MKAQLALTVVTLLSAVSACASETLANTDFNKQIIGSWNCQFVGFQNGSKITIRSQDTYAQNGRSNSSGILKVRLSPEAPEMQYSLAGSANWKVSEDALVTTFTDLKIVNVSHPGFDKIMNLQSLFPKNTSYTSRILELSASKLSLKVPAVEQSYHCTRKVK